MSAPFPFAKIEGEPVYIMWLCACGEVNRLSAHICAGCGVRRPDWYEGEDCDHDDV